MEGESLGQQVRMQLIKNMSEQNPTKTKINGSLTTQLTKIKRIKRILFAIGQAISYLH